MANWDQARQIVDRELRDDWVAAFPHLTWHVAEWGYADAQAFQVPYGAQERLVDGNNGVAIVGDLAALVDRLIGELELVSFLTLLDRLSTMERVGSRRPWGSPSTPVNPLS